MLRGHLNYENTISGPLPVHFRAFWSHLGSTNDRLSLKTAISSHFRFISGRLPVPVWPVGRPYSVLVIFELARRSNFGQTLVNILIHSLKPNLRLSNLLLFPRKFTLKICRVSYFHQKIFSAEMNEILYFVIPTGVFEWEESDSEVRFYRQLPGEKVVKTLYTLV